MHEPDDGFDVFLFGKLGNLCCADPGKSVMTSTCPAALSPFNIPQMIRRLRINEVNPIDDVA
jgi:hypothetical protein